MAKEKDGLTAQEEAVKRYLDGQAEHDAALRALYVPSRIKDCFRWITKRARKLAVGGCAMVEDAQVFKWARDYYLEELPKAAGKGEADAVLGRADADESPSNYEDSFEESDEKADAGGNFEFDFEEG